MKSTGFTLLELVAVLVILGVLGAVAGPGYAKFQRQSSIKSAAENLRTHLAEGFFSARSEPRIFGVRGTQGAGGVQVFSCDFPDCSTQETETISLSRGVEIKSADFEVQFLPPHGDISPNSFAGDALEITLERGDMQRILRIEKTSGLVTLSTP